MSLGRSVSAASMLGPTKVSTTPPSPAPGWSLSLRWSSTPGGEKGGQTSAIEAERGQPSFRFGTQQRRGRRCPDGKYLQVPPRCIWNWWLLWNLSIVINNSREITGIDSYRHLNARNYERQVINGLLKSVTFILWHLLSHKILKCLTQFVQHVEEIRAPDWKSLQGATSYVHIHILWNALLFTGPHFNLNMTTFHCLQDQLDKLGVALRNACRDDELDLVNKFFSNTKPFNRI